MANYLLHSAKGTSWEKTEHKYVWKKKKNGKWVYYYGRRKDGSFEGYSTESAIAAIENATENANENLIELRKAEHYTTGKEKIYLENKIEKAEKDIARMEKDKTDYTRSMNFYEAVNKTYKKSIEIGKKVILEVYKLKDFPKKYKEACQKNNEVYMKKYGKYFK